MAETAPTQKAIDVALKAIQTSDDVDKLKTWMANARRLGADSVYEAAFEKLVSLLPREAPGTIEYEMWRTIHAFEEMLTEERGKTTRLTRTRQKIARVGVMETLIGFATHPTSTEGFKMLIARRLADMTGEAIVLRHRDRFSDEVVAAARKRLEDAGVDLASLQADGN